MSRWLLSIVLCCSAIPLVAINIGRISFHAPAGDDLQGLEKATGLVYGAPYDPESVTQAIQRLYDHYRQNGRYFIKINAPELIPINPEEMELLFSISEPYGSDRVSVSFCGNSYFSVDKLKQLLALGHNPQTSVQRLSNLMEQVLDLYHERGYLFAKVSLDSLFLNPSPSACIAIEEGKPFRIENYIIRGNKITRAKTLIKLSGLSQVKTVTPAALSQARENLMQLSYISDCNLEPLDPSHLLIQITESRMTYLEGLVGLSTKDSQTQLSGQFRLQFMNLWGSDRAIMLFFKQIPKISRILNFNYHDPGINSLPVAADLELKRVEQDSTWISTSGDLSIYYQLLQQEIGVTLNTESLRPGSRFPAIITTTQANGASAFWNLSHLEGGMNPWKGMGFNLRYGIVNNQGEGNTHTTTEMGVFGCLPLTRRWVGYANLQARNINNPETELWQQFKMGGYGSLRGYHEDEFSSFRLGWTNYELRYLLASDSRVYVFFDQGFLGISNKRLKSDLFGIGGGIKVKTKLGIMGLEYALGYRDKRFSRIGLGMIHAGLTTNL